MCFITYDILMYFLQYNHISTSVLMMLKMLQYLKMPTPSMTVETLVDSEHESSMGMWGISSQRRELKDDVPVKPIREELNHLMPNIIIINTLEDVLGPWSGGKQLQEVDNTGTIFRQTWVKWGSGRRW